MATLPPIWVVSLRRATERRRFVEHAFAEAGLEIELIDAVDGYALTAEQRAEYSRWRTAYRYGRLLSPGAVGCALSHLAVWQRLHDAGLPEVVVFEDDTRPLPGFRQVLEERDQLPDDWDVVTFHSLYDWAGPSPTGVELAGSRACKFGRTPMGTQAYMLRGRAAERLLTLAPPVSLPADELLYRKRPARLSVYGLLPAPVAQADLPSEISDRPPGPEPDALERALYGTLVLAGRARRRLHRDTWTRTSGDR
jgi:glycosyl transferase family 25